MDEVAQKEETTFREKVTFFLDSLPKTYYESIQQLSISGTPDLLICCNTLFIAAEIKTNDGEATELQKYKLGKIERANGRAYIVRPKNFSEFKRDLIRIAQSKFL